MFLKIVVLIVRAIAQMVMLLPVVYLPEIANEFRTIERKLDVHSLQGMFVYAILIYCFADFVFKLLNISRKES